MTRGQTFATAVLAAVLVAIVLEPTVGRWMAIVVALAVSVAIDAGGRRLRARQPGGPDRRRDDDPPS